MTLNDAFDDFQTATTLLVTVQSDDQFHDDVQDAINRLEHGESIDEPDTYSFPDIETVFEMFTPQTMELLEAVATHDPASIRETARLVDRDIKNVHEELSELGRQGLIEFVDDGNAKQPVFPYEELIISLPFVERTVTNSGDATAPS